MKPVIGARFPLERGIDAIRRMERGDTSGKTAIVVDSGTDEHGEHRRQQRLG